LRLRFWALASESSNRKGRKAGLRKIKKDIFRIKGGQNDNRSKHSHQL
jgi:hypothetical protein